MAYQSLNIIGSFTAGTTAVQSQLSADRDRIEAYRALLRQQGRLRPDGTRDAELLVQDVDANDRMAVGDAPEDQRSPHLFQERYAQSNDAEGTTRQLSVEESPAEDPPSQSDFGPGTRLDVLI